jgi:hypothetical protein
MNRITLWVLGLATVVIIVLCSWIGHLNSAGTALALRAYNDSARLDTTRRVLLTERQARKILGDSLQAVTRLAEQRTLQRDELDKALRQERKVSLALSLSIDTLRAKAATSTAPVRIDTVNGQETRHAVFHVEQSEYSAQLGVSLPAAGSGTLDSLTVVVKPARIGIRIGCQDKNGDGIRPARVTATTPPWMHLTFDQAQQDPDVCQSQSGQRTSWLLGLFRSFAPEFVVSVGVSANPLALMQHKPVDIQPSIHAGVAVFHWPR